MKTPTCTVLSRAVTNMNLFSFQKCQGVVCVLLVVLTLIPQLIVNVHCQNPSTNANPVRHFIKSRDTSRNSNVIRNKNNQNKSSLNAIGTYNNSCIIQSNSSSNNNSKTNSRLSENEYGFRSSSPSGSNINRRNTKKKNDDPLLSDVPSIQEERNCSSIGDDKKERKRNKRKNTNPDNKKRREQKRRNNGKDTTATADSEPRRLRHADLSKLSLWIDEQQVKLFSGFSLEIHVISDASVLPYILDKNFEQYLPVIPAEVGVVNFTWRAGDRKYFYHFDRLNSFNEDILLSPIVSIDTRGRIPRKPKVFSVFLPCTGTRSGIATFTVGLLIETKKGPLPGTPLRLRLRKECTERNPRLSDPECDRKCANGGWCNNAGVCRCPEGYMGPFCLQALCYPQCMNGGVCNSPGVCSCPEGFHGVFCEGGICGEKCLNGGKCIQKDTCECTKGYYGQRCEYSKCMIPCLNGGKCKGINLCRCPPNFSGDHCEIGLANMTMTPKHSCSLPCRHGTCVAKNQCECYDGFFGRRCQRRSLK